MARDMTPVLKKCRALGVEPAFLGIQKKQSKKKENAVHKVSEYGMQLKEKQKAKFIYGVLEKPFRNYFEKAQKLKFGTTGENLLILLENRLDNVLFRMGLARTRDEARQIVSHRNVMVNGKTVNIPSYGCKVGDEIVIKDNAKSSQRFKDIVAVTASRTAPAWVTSDMDKLTGKVIAVPKKENIDVPVNEVAIVELYSK
ncbi:MAG: 30S ribosomal protein S4 [Saccharofermentans sp.]|jgi:small subunit ribosomal protein S4|nr:30S ribosomal protein S4 [Mageeibacillus sp.]MCI1264482.1 30S ribosomal protein S4 [Saccharofermentans sp.]MCI1275555.1 30S ribosomal protein S4 [Saccharofermentans sp.]MCI1768844.1 30S ribosomal protein S4 [Mageeibacillus sp.]